MPHTYVRSSADQALLPAVQDRFIAEADHVTPDNPFVVHDLDVSHFGSLLRPEPLAELLTNLDASTPRDRRAGVKAT